MKPFAVALFALVLGLSVPLVASASDPTAAPRTVTVLGEDLHITDALDLQDVVLERLFDQFAEEQGIEVAPAEQDAYVDTVRRAAAAEGRDEDDELTPEEKTEVEALRHAMAYGVIRQWKINKALYDQYGGRIVYQQFGLEPLDAYRLFLEQRERDGAFEIYDRALADSFWHYFTDESIHDFVPPGSVEEAQAFAVPPWEK